MKYMQVFLPALLVLLSESAGAGTRDQARRLFSSLTGVSPTKAYLDTIEQHLVEQRYVEAGQKIIQDHPTFYSITLKNFVTPWTSQDGSNLAALNDFSATIIGIVRDDLNFGKILHDNILYYADGKVTGRNQDKVIIKDNIVVPSYFKGNNAHYQALESYGVDLSDPSVLTRHKQNPILHRDPRAISGVLSTRTFGESFLQGGTNRAAISFTLESFLCKTMTQVSDTSIPDTFVRRDIDRKPGNDSRTFKSLCVGCHAGMDALGGAFAFYDFNTSVNSLLYIEGEVHNKMNQNSMFADGFVTTDDSWVDLWRLNKNPNHEIHADVKGNGAASFGKMLSQSGAFTDCMSQRVFEQVCFRQPQTEIELEMVAKNAAVFRNDNYNMKNLFVNTAITCIGE